MTYDEAKRLMRAAAVFSLMAPAIICLKATINLCAGLERDSLSYWLNCMILLYVPLSIYQLIKTTIPVWHLINPLRFKAAIVFGGGAAFFIPIAFGFKDMTFFWLFFWASTLQLIQPLPALILPELQKHFGDSNDGPSPTA